MKHRRGTRGAAPASDAARGMPLPARPAASGHVMPRGFFVFLADSRQLVPTRAVSAISAILAETADTAEIQKKRAQNAPFEPNIKP